MSQSKSVQFSSLHVRYANKAGIDVTRAAKLNRSFVRSNFDAIVKHWPELKATQKINRDGNRYPVTIPTNVADAILARNLSKLDKARAPRKPKVTTDVVPSVDVTVES
jgi:hypothetical protein